MYPHQVKRATGVLAAAMVLLLLLPPALAVPSDDSSKGPAPPDGADYSRAASPPGRAISNLPWPMFGRDAGHTANAGYFDRILTEPMLRWGTAGPIESGGMAVGNFTGNIMLNQTAGYERRTLHAVFAQNGRVEIVEASTGTTMWDAPLGGALLGTPAVSDFNGNNRLELVVVSSAGNVSCYEPVIEWNGTAYEWNGTSLDAQRRWARTLGAEASYSSPVLGDVSGDGVDDVVLCAGRELIVINGTNGNTVWNATLPGNLATSPVLVRYGADGLWVAAQSFNTSILLLERTYFSLFNEKGQESWTKNIALSTLLTTVIALPSPAAFDLNSDGFPETVFISPFESSNGRLYAYKQDGSQLWNSVQLKGQCEAPPAVGDTNGDNVPEVVAASWNYTFPTNARVILTAIDGRNGTEEWSRTVDRSFDLFTERAASGPALADLDHDGLQDIVLSIFNGRIMGLSGRDGGDIWEYNTTRLSELRSPSIADSELDGFPEVFVDGLVLAQRIADLALAPSDISFSTNDPKEGDTVSISAFIHNNGTKDVTNVTVRFADIYDNATVWSADKAIDVAAGGSAGATASWDARGGGLHRIRVTADPENAVEEVTEQNNEATAEISVFSHYTVSIHADQNETYTDAGGEASFPVTVKNEGDIANTINVTAHDVPAGWTATPSSGQLQLGAGKSATITVRVVSPAAASAGAYTVAVTAMSALSPANRASVTLVDHIRGTHGVTISPRQISQNVMADDIVVYRLNVTNTGNEDDTILFGNSTPPADWRADLSHQSVDLPGRAQMVLTVMVRPPPYAGEGAAASVDITAASSRDPSARATATTQTTVVMPDIVVRTVRFFRLDGVEADGTAVHLIDGKNATIKATVRNIRDNVEIPLLTVELYEGTIGLGNGNIAPLPAGEDGSIEVQWRPSEGVHGVKAVADPANRLRESDENNNELTVATSVKSVMASGPYTVSGTVTKLGGAPVVGGTVVVSNGRTGQTLSLGTDGAGEYQADLSAMVGGYQDEEHVTVTASDGFTTCSTAILAYSEDGGKRVDLVLTPGPYDILLTLSPGAANTDPLAPAAYRLWVTNLGPNLNTVLVNYSTLPAQWTAILENSSGVRTSLMTLLPAGQSAAADYMTLRLTPPASAPAGGRAVVRLYATSVNDTAVQKLADTTTTVNQVFSAELSGIKARLLRLGETARCNFTVKNSGNGNDTFDITVNGPEGLATVLDRTSLGLGGFSSQNTFVDVTASINITPGTYNLTLQARSRFSPVGTAGQGNLSITIEAFRYGVSVSGRIGALQQEDAGSVNFTVRNLGNAADVFGIFVRPDTPENLPAEWAWSIRRNGSRLASVGLEAGEAVSLELYIEPPREISSLASVIFNVSASSQADPTKTASDMVTLSIERPDLFFLGSLKLSAQSPREGDKVAVTLSVENQGFWESPPAEVRLSIDGKDAGSLKTPAIVKDGRAVVRFNWTATEGTHTIKAIVNPDGTGQIKELAYGNNDLTGNVVVATGGPEIAWPLIVGFAVMIAVVVAIFFAMTRKSKRRGRRPADEDEEEEERGDDEGEEEGGDEEGEEAGGGEDEAPSGEEEPSGEGAKEGSGDTVVEGGGEAEDVEAIEVVEEPQEPRPVRRKAPPKKPKRPNMQDTEVDMPAMMRIG